MNNSRYKQQKQGKKTMNIKNKYKEKIKKISFLFVQFIAFSFFMFIKSPAPHYSSFNFYKLSLNSADASSKYLCDRSDTLKDLEEKKDKNTFAINQINNNPNLVKSPPYPQIIKDLNGTNGSIFNTKLRECDKLIDEKVTKEKQCNEALSELNNSRKDYSQTCHKFAGGGTSCSNALKACSLCPSADTTDAEYKCVKIHKKTKCPALTGPDLKRAKEEKDKYKEDVKDLKEKIEDLRKDLTEEENELNTELVELEEEFNTLISTLQRDTENAKIELEKSLKESNSEIKSSVNEQVAKVQENINNALKVAHSFENALTQAYTTYKSEVQKVHKDCRGEALTQLMRYQTRRRQSILSGAYKISVSKLMNKNRTSFYQQDQTKLRYFYNKCLKLRKSDLNDIKTAYSVKLRQIEQQKELYEQNINTMKSNLTSLNQSAAKEQNQLLSSYTKLISSSMSKFESEYKSGLEKYNKNKQTLIINKSRKVNNLKAALKHKTDQLKELNFALVREQNLIHSLKKQGVQEEEDKTDDYAEASGNWIDYQNKILQTWNACDCKPNNTKKNNNNCPTKKDRRDARKIIKNIGKR